MRRVMAGADHDVAERLVVLPAAWDDDAAAALDGAGARRVVRWRWPRRPRPGSSQLPRGRCAQAWNLPLAERLHRMLLLRHGAPTAPVWQAQDGVVPGFVLNLASFHDTGSGFDVASFGQAVETAVTALTLAAPSAARIEVSVSDLALLLAEPGDRVWLGGLAGGGAGNRRRAARPGGSGFRQPRATVRERCARGPRLAGAARRRPHCLAWRRRRGRHGRLPRRSRACGIHR